MSVNDNVNLKPLTREQVIRANAWRNLPATRAGLRTPYMLTETQQSKFYDDVICNRGAAHRYWGVDLSGEFVGMCGLTDIQWENGIAEISLLTDPEKVRQGVGESALVRLFEEGFNNMRLLTIFGECYSHNESISFWERMVETYGDPSTTVMIPRRKYYGGVLHPSMWFTFTKEQYGRLR